MEHEEQEEYYSVLSAYEEKQIRLCLGDVPYSSRSLADTMVREKSDYMADMILDDDGHLQAIHMDKIRES